MLQILKQPAQSGEYSMLRRQIGGRAGQGHQAAQSEARQLQYGVGQRIELGRVHAGLAGLAADMHLDADLELAGMVRALLGETAGDAQPVDLAPAGQRGGAFAHERGVETLKYSRMLGRIMDRYTGVAVAGTHGKTSVSALLSWILQMAGKSPSFVIGGHAADLNGGGGAGDYYFEANHGL